MEVQRKKKMFITKSFITKAFRFLSHNEGAYYDRRVYTISDIDDENEVPQDVKEGHFAVIAAIKGEEAKRFIVELDYLTNPDFLRLLEKAKEEFGFEQKGTLIIPCKPQELQKIIQNRPMYR